MSSTKKAKRSVQRRHGELPAIVIDTPTTPNFLQAGPVGSKDRGTFPIADFSDDDLRAVGEAWIEALIEKARRRREDSDVG